jgi:bifunctional non-homologous end joining protein LigD
VFKSWAVTKGPSLDPRDRRLVVEVEDHPLDYGDFETIPQGEYGGGTVMLWDRGLWAPDDGGDPARGFRKGDLKFTLRVKSCGGVGCSFGCVLTGSVTAATATTGF